MDDSNDNNVNDSNLSNDQEPQSGTSKSGTLVKKIKRMCKFRDEWLKTLPWLSKSSSQFYARCKLCNKDFSISHGGINDVKYHANGIKHKEKLMTEKTSYKMSDFFTKQNSSESEKVSFAELVQNFHCVKHNLSYNSLNCGIKLLPQLFSDSTIAKKLSCGRTKSESIVKEVLGPKAEEIIIKALKNPETVLEIPIHCNKVYFSIMTDTSNKGNRKMYPICVQYFSFEKGCQNKLLDFFECSSETSDAISNNILDVLRKFDLDINYISAFSADNTNANFGKHRSAYTLLKEKNPYLLKANCLAHVVNNTFKYALNKLDLDVESVVLKIYSHFSSSSIRRENLKAFVEFVDLEWQELNKHVPTRWLSLGPAIEKILKFYPALMHYFLSLGEDCPHAFKILLSINENDVEKLEYNKTSLYLHFCANICSEFQKTNLKLQNRTTTSTELFSIMENLLKCIKLRIEEQYFGSHIRISKNHADKTILEQAKFDFNAFYKNICNYLNDHFDFNNTNPFKQIQPLSLTQNLCYDDIVKAATALGLENKISMDKLFHDYSIIKPLIPNFLNEDISIDQKWVNIFKSVKEEKLTELSTVISCALSIPPSNAFVERVFSYMSLKWTNVRNRCSVDLIKSELLISLNLDMSCTEFIDQFKNDKKLINAAQSNQKYIWKQK